MLIKTKFTEGTQSHFFYMWSKWKTQMKQQEQTDRHVDCTSTSVPTSVDISQPQPQPQEVHQPTPASSITLQKILSSGPYGPGILDHYKKHQSLDDKMRKLLVDAFLHYCTSNNVYVTKSLCESLSIEIKNTFQGEISVSYLIYYCKKLKLSKNIFSFRSITIQNETVHPHWGNSTISSIIGKATKEEHLKLRLEHLKNNVKEQIGSFKNRRLSRITFGLSSLIISNLSKRWSTGEDVSIPGWTQ